MLNVTKPVHSYLNNNNYLDSTNSDCKLNKLDELDETADDALQLNVPSLQIDPPGVVRSAGKLNRRRSPELASTQHSVGQHSTHQHCVDQHSRIPADRPSDVDPANDQSSQAPDDSKPRSRFGKMFRKLSNLKASKDDKKKKSSSDKPEKKKPLITVIHKTVTKNNVKLFGQENAENEDANRVSSKLSSEPSGDRPTRHSPNECQQSSRSNQSAFDESNLSSLPIDPSPSTNRKIEDVRSRSESKLANCQPRKQTSSKPKSEVEAHY